MDSPLKRQPASYQPPEPHAASAAVPSSTSDSGGSTSASSGESSSSSPSRSGSGRSSSNAGPVGHGSESGSEASGGNSTGSSVVVVGQEGGPNDGDDDAVDMDALDAEVHNSLIVHFTQFIIYPFLFISPLLIFCTEIYSHVTTRSFLR